MYSLFKTIYSIILFKITRMFSQLMKTYNSDLKRVTLNDSAYIPWVAALYNYTVSGRII